MMEDSNKDIPKKLADFYSTMLKFRVQEKKQKSSPPPIEIFEHLRKDQMLKEQTDQNPVINSDNIEERRREIHNRIRKAMEYSDTLLLYLPSFPILLFALFRKGKYTRSNALIWTLLGVFCHCLKAKRKYKWLGLFLNPTYLLIGEGIQFNNWKNGLIYSLSCFLASIVFLRISGAIAKLT